MEKQEQVGIYKLYKLGRLSGTNFSTDIKVLDRDLHPVHHDYAERINEHSTINGLMYEIDEKATKLYWSKKPYKDVKEFTDFEEVADDKEEATNDIEHLRLVYNDLTDKSIVCFSSLVIISDSFPLSNPRDCSISVIFSSAIFYFLSWFYLNYI